jgi:hypothetical protein
MIRAITDARVKEIIVLLELLSHGDALQPIQRPYQFNVFFSELGCLCTRGAKRLLISCVLI